MVDNTKFDTKLTVQVVCLQHQNIHNCSGIDSGGAGGARAPSKFGGSKVAKPDFSFSKFNYYSNHL